jgi:glycosyltransferase involved in cell wall biosynthesis
MERFNSMLKPAYVPFYFRASRWIRAAAARGERFDLAHQFGPVAMRYPSPVTGTGIPFVLGPVGGSLRSPPAFTSEEGTSAWYVGLRRFDQLRLRHDPWLRRTYREAGCVVGIAPYVSELLAGIGVRRFEVMSDTGIERMPEVADRSGRSAGLRLLFVGRLVRSKGARDAIRAVSLIGDPGVHLDVVGTGFDRAACESLAQDLRLGERVRFHGWVPRAEVEAFYRSADVFVFPSYREPGGTVVFEAMGHGLPLVVSDLGGPGNAVDDTCGIRVHPVSPEQYARDLAAAIIRLARSPDLRRELGAGARRRAREIGMWDGKAAKMADIYAAVLAGQGGSRRLGCA